MGCFTLDWQFRGPLRAGRDRWVVLLSPVPRSQREGRSSLGRATSPSPEAVRDPWSLAGLWKPGGDVTELAGTTAGDTGPRSNIKH